jgi:hypothetical protein
VRAGIAVGARRGRFAGARPGEAGDSGARRPFGCLSGRPMGGSWAGGDRRGSVMRLVRPSRLRRRSALNFLSAYPPCERASCACDQSVDSATLSTGRQAFDRPVEFESHWMLVADAPTVGLREPRNPHIFHDERLARLRVPACADATLESGLAARPVRTQAHRWRVRCASADMRHHPSRHGPTLRRETAAE